MCKYGSTPFLPFLVINNDDTLDISKLKIENEVADKSDFYWWNDGFLK